jgi:hypothetical protein
MTAKVDKLSADMALKANIGAASRDYVCEPNLGEQIRPGRPIRPLRPSVRCPRLVGTPKVLRGGP